MIEIRNFFTSFNRLMSDLNIFWSTCILSDFFMCVLAISACGVILIQVSVPKYGTYLRLLYKVSFFLGIASSQFSEFSFGLLHRCCHLCISCSPHYMLFV